MRMLLLLLDVLRGVKATLGEGQFMILSRMFLTPIDDPTICVPFVLLVLLEDVVDDADVT